MVQLNSKGTNKAIKFNILPDTIMKEVGFTNYHEPHWYFWKNLGDDISFSVTIPKDGSDAWVDVLDEDFGQPYDYQHILEKNPKMEFALQIKDKVEKWMGYLTEKGVVEGHVPGDYI